MALGPKNMYHLLLLKRDIEIMIPIKAGSRRRIAELEARLQISDIEINGICLLLILQIFLLAECTCNSIYCTLLNVTGTPAAFPDRDPSCFALPSVVQAGTYPLLFAKKKEEH